MSEAGAPIDAGPFSAGPFSWVPYHLPLAPAIRTAAWRRALITASIMWLPLAVLSAVECLATGVTLRQSMLFDAAALGRYLIGAPVLACAGVLVFPPLARVVREFRDGHVVAAKDEANYDTLVMTTRRLLMSPWTDGILIFLAYALTLATSGLLYPPDHATWVTPRGGGIAGGHLSLAGWWRLLISQPLFYVLVFVWVWRLSLWGYFLWRTMRMELRLVAAHPDRLGGLRFVLVPLRGFTTLAFALGAMAAGSVADGVLAGGLSLSSFKYLIGLQVLIVLLLLAGPVLVLMWPLIRLKNWGTFHYGELASYVGHAFERRWLGDGRPSNDAALAAGDFSATTDLYSITANVENINPFVLDLQVVAALVVATLLPYVPVVLMVMPLDEILEFAAKVLS